MRERTSIRQRLANVPQSHVRIAASFVGLLIIALGITVFGYVFQQDWTGVTNRTFWHWLELLVAPLLLSGGGFLLYAVWAGSEHRYAEKDAHEAAREANLDSITKGYLDEIEGLLLKVLEKNEGDLEERERIFSAVARARTLNVLEGVDEYRKGSIVRFLCTADLIKGPSQQVHFHVRLKGANLRRASLRQADLSGANLSETDLSDADLSRANLRETDLSHADLSRANLRGAYKDNDDGSQSPISNEELAQRAPSSLEGATMPNGQKYEDWLKDRESRRDDKEHSGRS